MKGDHQISDESRSARLPKAFTEAGKRSALPTVTTFGLKPCCAAWFQEAGEIWRDDHPSDNLHTSLF